MTTNYQKTKDELQSLWNRLALTITTIQSSDQITRKKLHQTIYLLTRLHNIHTDYIFEFQYYIPYSIKLDGDLILLEHWKAITIDQSMPSLLSYSIKAGNPNEIKRIKSKAKNFLTQNIDTINNQLQEFSKYSDKELDLIALAIFLADEEKTNNNKKLIDLIKFYRPKTRVDTIKNIIRQAQKLIAIKIKKDLDRIQMYRSKNNPKIWQESAKICKIWSK